MANTKEKASTNKNKPQKKNTNTTQKSVNKKNLDKKKREWRNYI